MKTSMLSFVLLVVLTAVTSCKAQTATVAPAARPATHDYEGFVIPASPQELLEQLLLANLAEIHQAEIILAKKPKNPGVQDFARMMKVQHDAAVKAIQAFAETRKWTLVNTEPVVAPELETLTQAALEEFYMSSQLGAHDTVLGTLAAGKQLVRDDKDFVKLLDELIPVVTQHRQHAYSLLGEPSLQIGAAPAATPTEPGSAPPPKK